MSEPFEDIHALFARYNGKYFEGRLNCTCVEWSDRMTLCAGLCYLCRQGTHRYCVIRLSRPLLQYRPFSDTISTLLHEMIHAYLWIIQRHPTGRPLELDRDGHGPDFLRLAAQINTQQGCHGVNITVYHTFHAEVNEARKHVWICDGKCRNVPPFFGLVRRAMNRAPQPADRWWSDHQASCGGVFTKIAGPTEVVTKTPVKAKGGEMARKSSQKGILDYWPKGGEMTSNSSQKGSLDHWPKGRPSYAKDDSTTSTNERPIQCPCCRSHVASNVENLNMHLDQCLLETNLTSSEHKSTSHSSPHDCPVCGVYATVDLAKLNDHIDQCLTFPSSQDRETEHPKLEIRPIVIDLT